jgi:hypothetical protein
VFHQCRPQDFAGSCFASYVLKNLSLGDGTWFLVLRPGFGPGSSARKAGILDRTILPEP